MFSFPLQDEPSRINVALGLKLKQYQERNKLLKQRVHTVVEESSKMEHKVDLPSSSSSLDFLCG